MLSVFPAALIVAAINDVYEFKIPNWITAALALAYLPASLAVAAPPAIVLEGVLLGVVTLLISFALYTVKFFGGGDAKLFAATTPWIGIAGLGVFLVNTAIAGMFVAFFLIAFRKTPPLPVYAQAPWLMRLHQRKHDLPYGVAIAVGGLLSFQELPFFQLVYGG